MLHQKKSFGMYWISFEFAMPAFHLVFDQGILDQFLNCSDFYGSFGVYGDCNGVGPSYGMTYIYECTD
jgi:hypothetical protein